MIQETLITAMKTHPLLRAQRPRARSLKGWGTHFPLAQTLERNPVVVATSNFEAFTETSIFTQTLRALFHELRQRHQRPGHQKSM